MRVICLSASNVIGMKEHSASTKVCHMIGESLSAQYGDQVSVETVALIHHDLRPCMMCGQCLQSKHCAHDPAFNTVFDHMAGADALFVVVPHYAPIPSKLVILMEKFEEIIYLSYLNDPAYVFPLRGKPVGVIGHGGMPEQYVDHYRAALVTPVANTLQSCQMEIVGLNEEWPKGVAFAIKDLRKPDDAVFPIIEHDWQAVRQRVEPLVQRVVTRAFEQLT